MNKKHLWTSLLLPPGVSGIAGAMMWASGSRGGEAMVSLAIVLMSVVAIGSWVFFAKVIGSRYKGRSAALLILAYPIGQFAICIAVFFCACLGAYSLTGKRVY